jgi:hypothetical protein
MSQVDPQLLEAAFSSDEGVRDAAREKIIEIATIDAFYECVDAARVRGDAKNLEFWFLELITCRGDAETIGKAIYELAIEVHEPQGRFHEGLVYLRYIQKSVYEDLYENITAAIARFEELIVKADKFSQSGGWETYDITKPIETGKSQQHYFDRFLCYFMATKEQSMDPIINDMRTDYLPRIVGFFIGIKSSIVSYGVEGDTVVGAFSEFIKIAYPDFVPGAVKMSSGAFGQSPGVKNKISPNDPREAKPAPAAQPAKPASRGYGISKQR